MNKQEIELLEQCREEIQNCYGRDTDLTEKISDYLEQQLTNGWIPVSERLPEEPGWYLTTIQREYNKETYQDVKDFTGNGFHLLFGHMKVIAWRPLPESYKGE